MFSWYAPPSMDNGFYSLSDSDGSDGYDGYGSPHSFDPAEKTRSWRPPKGTMPSFSSSSSDVTYSNDVSSGRRVFLIFDDDVEKAVEEWNPDSVLFKFPQHFDPDEILCGYIMGMIGIHRQTYGFFPSVLTFEDFRFLVRRRGSKTFLLGFGDPFVESLAVQRRILDDLLDTFTFCFGSVQRMKMLVRATAIPKTLAEMLSHVWKPILEDKFFGGNGRGSGFGEGENVFSNVLSTLPYHRVDADKGVVLKASQILKACRRLPRVVGGCILYDDKVILSDFGGGGGGGGSDGGEIPRSLLLKNLVALSTTMSRGADIVLEAPLTFDVPSGVSVVECFVPKGKGGGGVGRRNGRRGGRFPGGGRTKSRTTINMSQRQRPSIDESIVSVGEFDEEDYEDPAAARKASSMTSSRTSSSGDTSPVSLDDAEDLLRRRGFPNSNDERKLSPFEVLTAKAASEERLRRFQGRRASEDTPEVMARPLEIAHSAMMTSSSSSSTSFNNIVEVDNDHAHSMTIVDDAAREEDSSTRFRNDSTNDSGIEEGGRKSSPTSSRVVPTMTSTPIRNTEASLTMEGTSTTSASTKVIEDLSEAAVAEVASLVSDDPTITSSTEKTTLLQQYSSSSSASSSSWTHSSSNDITAKEDNNNNDDARANVKDTNFHSDSTSTTPTSSGGNKEGSPLNSDTLYLSAEEATPESAESSLRSSPADTVATVEGGGGVNDRAILRSRLQPLKLPQTDLNYPRNVFFDKELDLSSNSARTPTSDILERESNLSARFENLQLDFASSPTRSSTTPPPSQPPPTSSPSSPTDMFEELQRREDEALERLVDKERRCVYVEKHSHMTLALLCETEIAEDRNAIFAISKMALHEMAHLEWLLRQTPSRDVTRASKGTIYNFLRVDGNDDSLDSNIQGTDAAEYHLGFVRTASYLRESLKSSRSGCVKNGRGTKEIVVANRHNCVYGAKSGSKGQIFMQVCKNDQTLTIPKRSEKLQASFLERKNVKSFLKDDFNLVC